MSGRSSRLISAACKLNSNLQRLAEIEPLESLLVQHSECRSLSRQRDSRPFLILARVLGQGIPSAPPVVPK